MAVLGFDLSPLRSAITELGQGVRQGVQQQQQGGAGGDYLGYLSDIAQPAQRASWDTLGRIAPPGGGPSFGGGADFLGQLGAYAGQQGVLHSPAFNLLGALGQTGLPGGTSPLGGLRSVWDDLSAYANQLAFNAQQAAGSGQNTGPGSYPKPGPAPSAAPASGGTGGATYTGLPSDVAQWADQTNSTFGGLGGWVPAAMLAIIQHESGGKPGAYNTAGDAWGLFQQIHLGTNDPNAQFAAAKQLAQEKLASLQQSYATNGLNPDERTRVRDLFLAWAGHFDYDTGQPNAGSRDIGSGQDYNSFLGEIMPMYDNIVAGRQQTPPARSSAGGAGFAPITGGQSFPIMQGFGATDYAAQNPATYGYETQFGMQPGQHTGIDWAAPVGTKVYSPFAGRVVFAGGSGHYTDTMDNVDPAHSGEYMVQLDNGDQIILGHMSSISAQVGQRINAGDFVGLSGGSDGAHIHVEVRVPDPSTPSGYRIIDPTAYFGGH